MFDYSLKFVPYKFFVFGCGGTGSRLVPLMTQFIKSCDWLKPFSPEITLIDPDIVEEKNLFRQNFIRRDLDKGKSVVLASRYSQGFDLPIKAFFSKVSTNDSLDIRRDFEELAKHSREENYGGIFDNSIIFLCVDSISARKEIFEFIQSRTGKFSNYLIVDTGNENDFGQVKIMGNKLFSTVGIKGGFLLNDARRHLPNNIPVKLSLSELPVDLDYFYKMAPPAETRSCADLDQTMAINCMVANTAFSVLQNLLYRNPISAHRYNISLTHGIQPEYISWRYLDSVSCSVYSTHSMVRAPSSDIIDLYIKMVDEFPSLLKDYSPS